MMLKIAKYGLIASAIGLPVLWYQAAYAKQYWAVGYLRAGKERLDMRRFWWPHLVHAMGFMKADDGRPYLIGPDGKVRLEIADGRAPELNQACAGQLLSLQFVLEPGWIRGGKNRVTTIGAVYYREPPEVSVDFQRLRFSYAKLINCLELEPGRSNAQD